MHTFPVIAGQLHFNPRPPRGGRHLVGLRVHRGGQISIHALREESDRQVPQVIDSRTVFQSTPSARRATPTHEGALSLQAISIHALREESDTAAA